MTDIRLAIGLVALMGGLMVISNILAIVFGLRLKRLLRDVPCIESYDNLYDLKAEVRVQMHGALLGLALIGLTLLTATAGTVLYGRQFFFVAMLVCSLYGVTAVWLTKLEKKVRAIPVTNDEFQKERDHIAHVWVKKAFPDW